MKKIYLILALLGLTSLGQEAQAQQKWSAGFRTGISQMNWNMDEHDFQSYNLLWDNQLFLARKLGKRFELELTASYSQRKDQFNTSLSPSLLPGNYCGVFISNSYDVVQHRITAGLSGRYYFLKANSFETYTQLGFTCQQYSSNANITNYDIEDYRLSTQYTVTDNKISILNTVYSGLGINYFVYKALFLSAQANVYYKADGISSTGDRYQNYSEWSTGMFIGGGFRF